MKLCSNSGLSLTAETMDWGAYLGLFFMGWLADYPDPDSFLRVGFLHHRTDWCNEQYIRLVEQARRITDQEARTELHRQADRILVEEALILPLYYDRSHLLLKPWVKQYPLSPMKQWFWKDGKRSGDSLRSIPSRPRRSRGRIEGCGSRDATLLTRTPRYALNAVSRYSGCWYRLPLNGYVLEGRHH